MPEFLLEIGCEEIPAGWLPGVTAELGRRLAELAGAEHLQPEAVEAHSTPRRLIVRADVLGRQPDRDEELWGPALQAARDASGVWTGAALGFARKCGVDAEALRVGRKAAKGGEAEHLLFVRKSAGRPALEILPGVIAGSLRGLSFPKRMSWDAWLDDGKGAFPFGRPIRWMVALLGGTVVPFSVFEQKDGAAGRVLVASSATSYGHRFFPRGRGGEAFRVGSFAELCDGLRQRCVVVRHEERAAAIRAGLASVVRELADEHGLLHDWARLVEHPAVVVGAIPAEFQGLPRAVLETVLVHHQKYAPLLADGRVARFAAVTDTDGASAAAIARGMERVVVARLRDARFFFEEDLKRPLSERVADLAGVTFHQKLGSYREKAARLVRLVDAMAATDLLTEPQRQAAREAALLAKADLTTLMVREFPELQGVMGGIYLRAQRPETAAVAAAVQWHYHPLSIEAAAAPAGSLAGDELAAFAAVSLADKLDTLAGYFGIGLQPTGSSDPYGLRRAAQGVVRVLVDFWHDAGAAERRPSLRRLVEAALAGYGGALARPAADTAAELLAFLLDRIRFVLASRGFPADEVEAALGAREPDALDDPHEAWVRLLALHAIRREVPEDFAHLAVAFKRAKNILGGQAAVAVDAALLGEPAERELFQAVGRLQAPDGGHEARLRALAGLRQPVDRFFDDVLVMAEDERLRANRLALLASVLQLFYRIADISKLGGQA